MGLPLNLSSLRDLNPGTLLLPQVRAAGSAKPPPARKRRLSGCFVPAVPFSPAALQGWILYIRIVSNARGRSVLRGILGSEKSSWQIRNSLSPPHKGGFSCVLALGLSQAGHRGLGALNTLDTCRPQTSEIDLKFAPSSVRSCQRLGFAR